MKIRNLLAVVAVLSLFLFSAGTASAVISVNDHVPGYDVVIPIICEGQANPPSGAPTFGTLETLWAIADKNGGTPVFPSLNVVCATVYVYDSRSVLRLDTEYCWTAYDVVTDSCTNLISEMGPSDQAAMQITTSNGRTYFAGYVEVSQDWTSDGGFGNRFTSWVYLTDLPKGFASGMNGISAENGVGPQLGEDGGAAAVAAASIYPRMFIMNNRPDTWNWWMLLLGRNQYTQLSLPSFNRYLSCFICNEEEVCRSRNIAIPNELNLINVRDHVPGTLVPGCFGGPSCPIAGFGRCDIVEEGDVLLPTLTHVIITGTSNMPLLDPVFGLNPWYSLYGWSYQRAQESTATLSWDVMHEIHRVYCSGAVQGNQPDDNMASCSFDFLQQP